MLFFETLQKQQLFHINRMFITCYHDCHVLLKPSIQYMEELFQNWLIFHDLLQILKKQDIRTAIIFAYFFYTK